MVLSIVVFASLLVMTFVVVVLFTRPTGADRAVKARVAAIGVTDGNNSYLGDGFPEFLKHTKLSKIIWVDNLLQRWDLAHKIRLLLAQAESTWSVSIVLAASAVSAAVGFLVLYFWLPEMTVCIVIGILFAALPFFLLQIKRAR